MVGDGSTLSNLPAYQEAPVAHNPEKVMQFVKDELKKTPEIATSDLFEKAKDFDAGVKQLTLRQFNARFPLQVKRKQSLAQGGGRRKASSGKSSSDGATRRTSGRRRTKRSVRRDDVRKVFLKFAAELTEAEERRELVRVLASVDDHVDEVMEAAGR